MIENLLTNNEIKQILLEAKNPKYEAANLLHLGRQKTSIFKVSASSGLILVHGNECTGREHIDNRHNPTSRIPYWDENGVLGNPTKFDLNLAPIYYMTVAEQIYKPENLNNKKNKRQEVFDTFIGDVKFQDTPEVEYTLVVYKNTGIIHTLYISSNKKPFNKKKILDLRQGWVSACYNVMAGIETFEMPYFDTNDIEKFKVILRCNKGSGTDKWYVQVNNEKGSPTLTAFIKEERNESQLKTPFRMTQIDFSNVTWIEREIKKIIMRKSED